MPAFSCVSVTSYERTCPVVDQVEEFDIILRVTAPNLETATDIVWAALARGDRSECGIEMVPTSRSKSVLRREAIQRG